MRFYALVEDWPGESKAYFRELQGCLSSVPTYEEAVKTAPVAILTFLKWLKKNELTLIEKDDREIGLVVSDRLAAVKGLLGPKFHEGLGPTGDVEIDDALNV